MAAYEINIAITFPNTNGIKNVKFKTNGVPKITGSVIPNNAGTKDKRPKLLYCDDFAKKAIKKTKPKTHPPKVNVSKNAFPIIFVPAPIPF